MKSEYAITNLCNEIDPAVWAMYCEAIQNQVPYRALAIKYHLSESAVRYNVRKVKDMLYRENEIEVICHNPLIIPKAVLELERGLNYTASIHLLHESLLLHQHMLPNEVSAKTCRAISVSFSQKNYRQKIINELSRLSIKEKGRVFLIYKKIDYCRSGLQFTFSNEFATYLTRDDFFCKSAIDALWSIYSGDHKVGAKSKRAIFAQQNLHTAYKILCRAIAVRLPVYYIIDEYDDDFYVDFRNHLVRHNYNKLHFDLLDQYEPKQVLQAYASYKSATNSYGSDPELDLFAFIEC